MTSCTGNDQKLLKRSIGGTVKNENEDGNFLGRIERAGVNLVSGCPKASRNLGATSPVGPSSNGLRRLSRSRSESQNTAS